jgi:hypothetical protein
VRREERLLVLLEVLFVSGKHAVEPREELVSAVITVENYRT